MLPAVEVEFENDNVDHPDEIRGITDMDVDEESAAGNNFIYIIYKISFTKKKRKEKKTDIDQSSKHRATFFIYGSFPNPLPRLLPHN